MTESFSLLLVVTFLAIFMISIGVLLLGPRHQLQKRLRRHLDQAGGSHPVHQVLRRRYVEQLPPWLQKVEALPVVVALDLLTLQAGKSNSALSLIVLCLGILLFTLVVMLAGQFHWSLVLVVSVLMSMLPIGYLQRLKSKRINLFDQQLPDWLDMMVKALKAGLPLIEAMDMSARELGDPVAAELKQTVQDIEYSSDVEHAFLAMMQRVPSEPLLMVVTAVLLQRETGGNLLKVLTSLRVQIRERTGFDRRLQTLSAEGRMSAWILVLMPFVLGLLINMVSPGYLSPLFETDAGTTLLSISGVLMVLGIFWVIRLIRIQI